MDKTYFCLKCKEKVYEYTKCISDIKQSIVCLKILLDSIDICLVSLYRPRNNNFGRLPAKLNMTKPILHMKG